MDGTFGEMERAFNVNSLRGVAIKATSHGH